MTEIMGDDNKTLYVGNLDSKVTEELLYELFLQAGPIKSVTIPKDKSTKKLRSFGFICFKEEVSMPYAYHLLRECRLFGRPLKIEPRNKRYNIPPVTSVGVHSLEPKECINYEEQKPEFGNLNPLQYFPNFPCQQVFVASPFPPCHMNMPLPYFPPTTIDTDAMNNFKKMFEGSSQLPNSNRYNMSDQNANYSPNSSRFNDGGSSFYNTPERDRSHNGNRFSVDEKSLSPRLSGRLEFPNRGNMNSLYNSPNNSPNSNHRSSPNQHHSNSPHRNFNNYNRNNNRPHSNYNSPYNDSTSNCKSSDSPHINRNFSSSSRNNSPYNDRSFDRDRFHGFGKRDSYGNDDRRDSRRSRDGGGGGGSSSNSSGSYRNHYYHNDRNHRY